MVLPGDRTHYLPPPEMSKNKDWLAWSLIHVSLFSNMDYYSTYFFKMDLNNLSKAWHIYIIEVPSLAIVENMANMAFKTIKDILNPI
jgi:hypothetical protein